MSNSTAATSDARRAQLERLKEQRRANRAVQSHARRVIEQTHKPFPVTLPRLIAEVQRIAMSKVMPRSSVFDHAKPATWPSAEELCAHFEMSWSDIATEAGLQMTRARQRVDA